MADIPLAWRDYAARQSDLKSRSSIDAFSWGMEEGLNFSLEGGNLDADPGDVDRVVASAARRNRYARSLLAKHVRIGEEVHDPTSYLEARSSVSALQRSMPSDGLSLLVDLAAGAEYSDLAAQHRISAGALRTRAARARQRAREIAA